MQWDAATHESGERHHLLGPSFQPAKYGYLNKVFKNINFNVIIN